MAERAASEGARLLEALFHSHSGVKLLIDPADGRIVDANPAAVRFYGYPRETLLAMSIWDINILPKEAVLEAVARARARDVNYFEFRHRLASGEVRDVAVNSSPVEVDGRLLLFSIIHDITDRVQAERELRNAQAYQRALFDGQRDALIVTQTDGVILDANPAAEALLGRPRGDIVGRRYTDMFPEPLRAMAAEHFAARVAGGDSVDTGLMSCEVERSGGERVPVEIACRAVTLGDGRRVLLGVFRDVSSRRASEEELRRLTQILEQSPLGIMVTDLEGAITWVNPAFTRLTGYSAGEVLGQNPRLLKSGQTSHDVYADLWATITSGRTWHGEVVNRRKNGQLYREELVISPLRDGSGAVTHYVAMKQDVTERRRLEEQLRKAQRLEAIGQLAGGVAHDFNNILAAQLVNLNLLRERTDLDAEVRELLEELEQGARLAADVARKLLALGRRQSLARRVVSLDAQVEELMKLLRRVLPETITAVHQRAREPTWVDVDVAAVEQAVMNLVVNARDAMPAGGTLTVSNALTDHGRTVTLTVQDTGCGIDPKVLPHIFEPFFTQRPDGRGTGLGLATVYGVMQQHGGAVEVDSTPGQGTTFRLKFPAAPPTGQYPTPPPTAYASRPLKVLLVEDDGDVRRALARSLASLGHEVVEATNAADALAQWPALRDGVDVLLTDVVMPGELSGVQLARRLRADKEDLFVVVASGHSGDQTKDLEPGFHFLPKPFRVDELRQLLAQAPGRQGLVHPV